MPSRSIPRYVGATAGSNVQLDALLKRTGHASTPEVASGCLPEVTEALQFATAPIDRARLLMCHARVRSLQLLDREACEDAAAAVSLFETAGEAELIVDAASLGAAHASRLGDVSLASELAAKAILGLDSVQDDRLRMEVTNRLGVFCYYYLDYDKAVELFESSLAAAERIGDRDRVCRELYNVTDSLLLAAHNKGFNFTQLERAEFMARRLVLEIALKSPRLGSRRLLAEVLCDLGQVDAALQVFEDFRTQVDSVNPEAPCSELAWVRRGAFVSQVEQQRPLLQRTATLRLSQQARTSTT